MTHHLQAHSPGKTLEFTSYPWLGILLCCSIFDLSRFRLVGTFRSRFGNVRILLLALCLLLFACRFHLVARFGNRTVRPGCTLLISIFSIRFGRHVARDYSCWFVRIVCSYSCNNCDCIDSISMMQSMRLFMHLVGFMRSLKCDGCSLHAMQSDETSSCHDNSQLDRY